MGRQASSARTGKVILAFDDSDQGAFTEHLEYRNKGGRLQVKGAVWKRWKDATEYLCGTICTFRDGDCYNLRRDNLKPALDAWLGWKKYT